MDVKKKILLFLLIGGVTVIQAQKNEKFTPPTSAPVVGWAKESIFDR